MALVVRTRVGRRAPLVFKETREPDGTVENAVILEVNEDRKPAFDQIINPVRDRTGLRSIEHRRKRLMERFDHVGSLRIALALRFAPQHSEEFRAVRVAKFGDALQLVLPARRPGRDCGALRRCCLFLFGRGGAKAAAGARKRGQSLEDRLR